MPASNDNWVCFECRMVIRYPKIAKQVPKCLACGSGTFWLGSKVEVPKKDDVRGWRHLRDDCRTREIVRIEKEAADRRSYAKAAKLRIEQLEALPANKERSKLIAQLTRSIEKLLLGRK
ncbi:MAG: hypothetical protein WBO68_15555 [Pyrinomonadaceae bacterium]